MADKPADAKFERFTERARRVMFLANQEAQRFNHDFIGTEHLLLGLVKEGSGMGADVLRNLSVDLRKVRLEVEKLVRISPEMVTMGRLPQTPRAKRVVEFAIEESRALNDNYVGTEHLLLGLLRQQDGVAAQVLMNLGLKLKDVREEVVNLLSARGAESPRSRESLDDAPDKSRQQVEIIPEVCAELLDAILAAKQLCICDAQYERASHLGKLQNEFESFAKRLSDALTKPTE